MQVYRVSTVCVSYSFVVSAERYVVLPQKKGGWGETTRSSDYGLQQVAKTLLNWPVARFSTTALKFLAIGLEISGRTRLTTLTEITGISDNETLLYQGPSTYTY